MRDAANSCSPDALEAPRWAGARIVPNTSSPVIRGAVVWRRGRPRLNFQRPSGRRGGGGHNRQLPHIRPIHSPQKNLSLKGVCEQRVRKPRWAFRFAGTGTAHASRKNRRQVPLPDIWPIRNYCHKKNARAPWHFRPGRQHPKLRAYFYNRNKK